MQCIAELEQRRRVFVGGLPDVHLETRCKGNEGIQSSIRNNRRIGYSRDTQLQGWNAFFPQRCMRLEGCQNIEEEQLGFEATRIGLLETSAQGADEGFGLLLPFE